MGKHKTGYLVNCPLLVNFNDLFCGILASLISFKALVQIVFVIPCWKFHIFFSHNIPDKICQESNVPFHLYSK